MAENKAMVKVGETAPGFCLPNGLTRSEACLHDSIGSWVYLMFLRGNW